MGESASHVALVRRLLDWTLTEVCQGEPVIVLVDLPEYHAASKPKRIGGFTPDLCAAGSSRYGAIVGEAKTAKDIERKHTVAQLEAFMKYCNSFDQSLLVLAVPWDMVPLTRSIIRDIRLKTCAKNVETVVLEKLVV